MDRKKHTGENPIILRFNVDDVSAAAAALTARGVSVEVKSFTWGTVATFADPDGNLCELKNADDPFFTRRVQ